MRWRDVIIFGVLVAVASAVILNQGKIPLPLTLQQFVTKVEGFLTGIDFLGRADGQNKSGAFTMAENATALAAGAAEKITESTPDFFCRARSKKSVAQAQAATVYKWVDASGRTHYGDRLPSAQTVAQTLKLDGQLTYFDLQLHTDNGVFPPHFRDRLTVRVNKAYQVLSQLIPAQLLSQVDVNLWVFNSQRDYEAFQRQFAPDVSAASQGFHNAGNNIAAAWRIADAQVLATSVHESVHVMNAGMFGRIPRWLNEGLAEYMEDMQVYGQSVDIGVAADWLRQLQQGQLKLGFVLTADDAAWQGSHRLDLYAHSWALVYFLMSSDPGRKLLSDFLVASAQNPCQLLNAKDYLQLRYPGGIAGMELQFRRWLRAEKPVHHI